MPPSKKGKKKKSEEEQQPAQNITNPDYEILAEIRGHAEADTYRIQVEFVDVHSNQILFTGLYRIRKEAENQPAPDVAPDVAPPPSQPPENQPPPPPAPPSDLTAPTTSSPSGNQTL